MSSRRLFSSLAAPFLASLPQGSGFTIKDLPGKGRGLVASHAFENDDVVLAEEPIVACAVADDTRGCGEEEEEEEEEEEGGRPVPLLRGCVPEGDDLAQAALEETSAGQELARIYSEPDNPRRYPAMALRMACDSLLCDDDLYAQYWQRVLQLAAAMPPADEQTLAVWRREHGLVASSLEGFLQVGDGDSSSNLFADDGPLSFAWYSRVLGTLHVNTLRTSAASAAGHDRGAETGLFALASLFNHDCEPNV